MNSFPLSLRTPAVYIDCDGIADNCQTKDRFFQLLNQAFCDAEKEKQESKRSDLRKSHFRFLF